jgi:hypothetical protein
MVSKKVIREQLKSIGFKQNGWGRAEISELPRIILPNEEIYECVNGYYEGGFALLVATDIRVLLIDKKPLNYLTVEDMRFDMISEMDYSHRIIGADINISSGGKVLHFRSYNQHRLRKLIGHVQHCMAEIKKRQSSHEDSQVSHLEQINSQLQEYLVAQQQYQIQLQQLSTNNNPVSQPAVAQVPAPPRPSGKLSDYLYSQSLLNQYQQTHDLQLNADPNAQALISAAKKATPVTPIDSNDVPQEELFNYDSQLNDIYADGHKEVFGSQNGEKVGQNKSATRAIDSDESVVSAAGIRTSAAQRINSFLPTFDINPMHIAYSKLPLLLKNRKLRQPSMRRTSSKSPKTTLSNAQQATYSR